MREASGDAGHGLFSGIGDSTCICLLWGNSLRGALMICVLFNYQIYNFKSNKSMKNAFKGSSTVRSVKVLKEWKIYFIVIKVPK